jgi:hypothetical protein
MNGFSDRIKRGNEFEDTIEGMIRSWGISIVRSGMEHTHPIFMQLLRASEDITSLMVRHMPDFTIAMGDPPSTAFLDAKNSVFIEKNAYENYKRISDIGGLVFLVCNDKQSQRIVYQYLFNVRTTNNCNHKYRFPIDSDGWISPRLDNNILANAKANGFRGAGTPYKKILTDNMKPFTKDNFISEFDIKKPQDKQYVLL